jgi:hypothetical protein
LSEANQGLLAMDEENSVRKEGIRQGILRWYEIFYQIKDYAKTLTKQSAECES